MQPFPTELELLELFAAELVVMDRDIPWHLTTFDVTTRVGSDRLDLTVEASYGEITVRWSRADEELLHLKLHDVGGLAVERDRARGALLATFADHRRLDTLRLQVRPRVHLLWSTRR